MQELPCRPRVGRYCCFAVSNFLPQLTLWDECDCLPSENQAIGRPPGSPKAGHTGAGRNELLRSCNVIRYRDPTTSSPRATAECLQLAQHAAISAGRGTSPCLPTPVPLSERTLRDFRAAIHTGSSSLAHSSRRFQMTKETGQRGQKDASGRARASRSVYGYVHLAVKQR